MANLGEVVATGVAWKGSRSAEASVAGQDWMSDPEGRVSSGFSVDRLMISGSSAMGEGRAAVVRSAGAAEVQSRPWGQQEAQWGGGLWYEILSRSLAGEGQRAVGHSS